MRIRYLLALSALVVALFPSCAPTGTVQPRFQSPSVPSVLPLVRVPGAPGNPFVRATVNGRSGLFLVDTGAFATCLDS